MHQGGAYPKSAPQDPTAANQWAWSPAGINAALSDMSKVAQGQTGAQAVHSIVFKFERPLKPAAEYANAMKAYSLGVFTDPGGITGAVQGAAGSVGSAVSGAASDVGAVTSFLGDLSKASVWLRGLQIAGGGIILLLGLYLLAKQVGLAADLPAPVSAAANVVPQVREARALKAAV